MRRTVLLIALAAAASFAVAQDNNTVVPDSSVAIHPRQHGPMKLVGIPVPGAVQSSNWSGYAVTGTSFTKALGSWVVPKVTNCSTNPNSYSSFWVGIDGYSDTTVEQIGTDSDCNGTTPVYYAWYEFYPNAAVLISGITVTPGDNMGATVSFAGSTFTLKINDHTTGKIFTKSGTLSGALRTSAEWIAEAPSDSLGILPLADFTKVSMGIDYTSVNDTDWAVDSAVTGPISDFGSVVEKITMVNGAITKAQPSALTTDGSSFKVTWKHK